MLSVLSFRTVRYSQSDQFFIIQTVRNNYSFISNIVSVSQYSVIQYQIHHLLVIYISISVNSVFQNLIISTLMLSVFKLSSPYLHEFSYSYVCMYVLSRSYQLVLSMHITLCIQPTSLVYSVCSDVLMHLRNGAFSYVTPQVQRHELQISSSI